jgi:hypothetical protein
VPGRKPVPVPLRFRQTPFSIEVDYPEGRSMNGKLTFSALVLLLACGLDALPATAGAGQRCRIACETDPQISCSSEVGDCRFYYGAYDYIVCDGFATQCPLP